MDGLEHQQRYRLPEENVGFTKVLVTTHRQNFLLPPRVHRSMPLAEMLWPLAPVHCGAQEPPRDAAPPEWAATALVFVHCSQSGQPSPDELSCTAASVQMRTAFAFTEASGSVVTRSNSMCSAVDLCGLSAGAGPRSPGQPGC